jgi:hypothetical protein
VEDGTETPEIAFKVIGARQVIDTLGFFINIDTQLTRKHMQEIIPLNQHHTRHQIKQELLRRLSLVPMELYLEFRSQFKTHFLRHYLRELVCKSECRPCLSLLWGDCTAGIRQRKHVACQTLILIQVG